MHSAQTFCATKDRHVSDDGSIGDAMRVSDLKTEMDERFTQVDQRFAQVDQRFAQVDARFAQVDARFAQVDERLVELQKQIAAEGEATRRHFDVVAEQFRQK
jgi:septal ring factor EnvC (AmiA/AmiB activator)